MTHFRLRTQLFIATLLIICGLTGALLLIIRHTVSVETERQVRDGTEASVRAFSVDALAQRRQHSQLYDPARLAANDIPLSAVIYHDDMFVDAELSLHTARHVGNLDFWITNEFEHDGIRQAGTVFRRLVDMVRDKGGPRAAA